MAKAKSKYHPILNDWESEISDFLTNMGLVSEEPDRVAIALLLLPSTEQVAGILQQICIADNIEKTQIEEIRKELSRFNERTKALLKIIETSTQ